MSGSDTDETWYSIPAMMSRPTSRPSPRLGPRAEFVSQLIASREHLMAQRRLLGGPLEHAVAVYGAGAKITVRRLPNGFRCSFLT